jgi:hypothetical protein
VKSVVSSENGEFRFDDLDVGTYRLQVTNATGYDDYVGEALEIRSKGHRETILLLPNAQISVGISEAKNITISSAYFTVTYSSDRKITEVGCIYSTSIGNLDLRRLQTYTGTASADFGVASGTPTVGGTFDCELPNLKDTTAYFVKPYIKFETPPPSFPEGYFVLSDYKTFTTLYNVPKPIASVFYENKEVIQNGIVDAGDVFLTLSKNITVVIRNTGTKVLTIAPDNITITGTEAAAFANLTTPGISIAVGGQSSFTIECKPIKLEENNAILTIPSDDESRNPIIVNLKVRGKKGGAVVEVSQAKTIIANNSVTPFDFGVVEAGNSKTIAFTIKNTGNISLELTGDPVIESSNSFFTVVAQPTKKILASGDSVSFALRFTPTDESEKTGTISIMSNSDDMLFSFSVKAKGYEKKPQIVIKQGVSEISHHGEYDFGIIATGKTKDVIFTIENSGDANLTFIAIDGKQINLADNAGNIFSVTQQPSQTTVVTPENATTFAIRFSPIAVGNNFNATVQIKTNSRENDVFSFKVVGSAYAAGVEARLSKLEFTSGTLSPAFNANIYEYDLRIIKGLTSTVKAKPTSVDSDIGSITVNGIAQSSDAESQDIVLNLTDKITIVITAEDGTTTATYIANIKIVNTWEKLHGQTGKRYGVWRAVSNGEGGVYAGGYTDFSTAAFFNFDGYGNLQNSFAFPTSGDVDYQTLGVWGMGTAYNDYYAIYDAPNGYSYYLTKAVSSSTSPTRTLTSLTLNGEYMYMYPAGIVKNGSNYFVAGNAEYLATATASDYTYGIFVNRHFGDGSWEMGKTLSLSISGIEPQSYEVTGMTMLANGDVLIYGEAIASGGTTTTRTRCPRSGCTTSTTTTPGIAPEGMKIAFAAAINVSAASASSWAVRWINTYAITNKTTYFKNHFVDNASNIILLGGTDDGGLVVKFPGNATTAAAAKPSGWPKVIAGTLAEFGGGLAIDDGSGYLFVGGGRGAGSHGDEDVWVVKTDINASAAKIWEKFFGGAGIDYADAVVEQSDGFIILGSTNSSTIAGQTKTGTEDVYILKMNKDGSMD